MSATRRQVLTGAAGVVLAAASPPPAFVQAQTRTALGAIPDSELTVSIVDTTLGPDDLVARVPVTLSVPAPHTIVVGYVTADGAEGQAALRGRASTGASFAATRGQLIFQPGEQKKLLEFTLPHQLERDQSIGLQIADFGYPRRTYARGMARITSGDARLSLTSANDTRGLSPLPSGGTVVFSDDLRDADFASDSGFCPNGRPCWQSRSARTR